MRIHALLSSNDLGQGRADSCLRKVLFLLRLSRKSRTDWKRSTMSDLSERLAIAGKMVDLPMKDVLFIMGAAKSHEEYTAKLGFCPLCTDEMKEASKKLEIETEHEQDLFLAMIDSADGITCRACVSLIGPLPLEAVLTRLANCDDCRKLNWRLERVPQ